MSLFIADFWNKYTITCMNRNVFSSGAYFLYAKLAYIGYDLRISVIRQSF